MTGPGEGEGAGPGRGRSCYHPGGDYIPETFYSSYTTATLNMFKELKERHAVIITQNNFLS